MICRVPCSGGRLCDRKATPWRGRTFRSIPASIARSRGLRSQGVASTTAPGTFTEDAAVHIRAAGNWKRKRVAGSVCQAVGGRLDHGGVLLARVGCWCVLTNPAYTAFFIRLYTTSGYSSSIASQRSSSVTRRGSTPLPSTTPPPVPLRVSKNPFLARRWIILER